MLVVLDTGVFVSAAITPEGVASRIVTAGVAGRFQYLLCPRLVGELTGVLARPKFARLVSDEHRRRFLAEVVAAGRDASDPVDVPAVSRDPDDDYLVALAAGQQAERASRSSGSSRDIGTFPKVGSTWSSMVRV